MTGQKGPCGNNMIFYSVANDSVYGECDCNYDIECRSLIYSSVYDECFFAYEQVSGNRAFRSLFTPQNQVSLDQVAIVHKICGTNDETT